MAIFDKSDKPLPGPGTVIGTNVKLVGALRDINDIAVHGTIDGEVVSEKNVTVGETAQVKGPVMGNIVMVAGTVRGSIEAANRLEILPTGKVYGNIAAKDLIIRSGASFVGKSVMVNDRGKKAEESVGVEESDRTESNRTEKATEKLDYETE